MSSENADDVALRNEGSAVLSNRMVTAPHSKSRKPAAPIGRLLGKGAGKGSKALGASLIVLHDLFSHCCSQRPQPPSTLKVPEISGANLRENLSANLSAKLSANSGLPLTIRAQKWAPRKRLEMCFHAPCW